MARKSAYDERIKPYLAQIREWVRAGATVEEIAKALGLNASTIYKYKAEKSELTEAFAQGRAEICVEIKAALLKKALGFTYEEKRQSLKDDGDKTTTYTEIITRYCVPSETAAAMLLRNYDDTWRDNDNTSVKFKQQEAELKRRIAESEHFINTKDLEG